MIELLDRSRLRRVDLPRAFMQDMLLPFRGRSGAVYTAGWGEKDLEKRRRFEVALKSFAALDQGAAHHKLKRDGTPRTSRKLARTLGPEHADVLVALFLIQQASVDSADLHAPSYQLLWRAMHAFRPGCGNYSGEWKKKVGRALDELSRCEMKVVDRGDASDSHARSNPITVEGPLLRVFWLAKQCVVAGRNTVSRGIERILWGPAIEYLLTERQTMTFRADEYFSIRSGAGRIAYLFAPAPAAARARDQLSHPRADGAITVDFSQSSSSLLLKLGYDPHELADRYRRHRLLLPLQRALDTRSLANGHLCVSVTRHHPPDQPRHDWRLAIRVSGRRPSGSSPVEDVTFVAAQEGGRTKGELYAALRRLPELDDPERNCIGYIWPAAAQTRAIAWARKAKALLLEDDRRTFTEILAEVKMLKSAHAHFRKAPAAMAVGLIHKLLRTHEWPLPGRRRAANEPPG